MSEQDDPLRDYLRAELAEGPRPFEWFMRQALYHAEWGYYSRGVRRTGRCADFITAPTLTPAFGAILAAWARRCWEATAKNEVFVFVEQGAGDGSFAAAFLSGLEDGGFRDALSYRIIEPFEPVERLQTTTLRNHGIGAGSVSWYRGLADAGPFRGVHFSNELPDAMPVHRCVRRGKGWMECAVMSSGKGFEWIELPVGNAGCSAFLAALPPVYPEGYLLEVNLAAEAWIKEVAANLVSGHVLTFDYGHAFADRYDPRKTGGTLSAYRAHRRELDLLAQPGETDLTSHVDFSGLAREGVAAGLQIAEYTTQSRFLTHAAALSLMRLSTLHPDGLRFLLHPTSLGDSFKALLFRKHADSPPPWNSTSHHARALDKLGLHQNW